MVAKFRCDLFIYFKWSSFTYLEPAMSDTWTIDEGTTNYWLWTEVTTASVILIKLINPLALSHWKKKVARDVLNRVCTGRLALFSFFASEISPFFVLSLVFNCLFKATRTATSAGGGGKDARKKMSGGEEREGSPLPWGAASNPAGEEEEVLISEFRWSDMRFKSDLHNLQLFSHVMEVTIQAVHNTIPNLSKLTSC